VITPPTQCRPSASGNKAIKKLNLHQKESLKRRKRFMALKNGLR
jgi:hypothetical protein